MQINVLEYFEQGALAKCPGKTAVVDHDRSYTFAELERFAKNCAALILQRTAAFNQPIAVFLPKSAAVIIADLGVLYSGNCYANLDINSPPERLKSILTNLAAAIIITSTPQLAALRSLGVAEGQWLLVEEAFGVEIYDENVLRARRERVIDTNPLCVIHTSGSTGVPKGVALSHRNTIDFLDWAFDKFSIDGSEIVGSLAPAFFDIYTLEMNMCLAKGSTLMFIPSHYAVFPAKLVDFLAEKQVSFIYWVSTIMVNIANQDLMAGRTLEAIKKVLFGAEVLPAKHLNYWRRHVPNATFINNYGPAEITVQCTCYIIDREFTDADRIPLGFACRNTDLLILNEHDELVKGEEAGEVCVRGSCVGLGYWNNPEKTAAAFVQNPLNPHYPEIIYRTGDLASRNSRGELMFLGRKDFQIKHYGYRIEMGEIEHAAFQVEGVKNCCVTYNHEKKDIQMFFEAGKELTPAFIRKQLLSFVPKYMLPTVFRQMEQLPKTPNGKIDRQKLSLGAA